jgi:hypothetical protein
VELANIKLGVHGIILIQAQYKPLPLYMTEPTYLNYGVLKVQQSRVVNQEEMVLMLQAHTL